MSEQEKNEQALKQLGIEIPEGWEFVRYGEPMKDEYFIKSHDLIKLSGGTYSCDFIIIKKKIETECWYLVEDEDEECVMFLNNDMTWVTYRLEKESDDFDCFKIISKIVVEK